MSGSPDQTPGNPGDEHVAPPVRARFFTELEERWSEGKFVCVGLDSAYAKLPDIVKSGRNEEEAIVEFNRQIIDATADLVSVYKPNAAFYERSGEAGQRALRRTIRYIHDAYPGVPVILDAKRADIGTTNEGYADAVFNHFEADAVTVNPYFGLEAMEPFLKRTDKGVIVLVRTSNKGAATMQDGLYTPPGEEVAVPYYQFVAREVATRWNTGRNCAVVVGATAPEPLAQTRAIVGDEVPILIPGIGTQGGDLEAAVTNGRNSLGQGMIINSSSAIIFASKGLDFAEAARAATVDLDTQIRQAA